MGRLVRYRSAHRVSQLINETPEAPSRWLPLPGDLVRPQLFEGDEVGDFPLGLVLWCICDERDDRNVDAGILWSGAGVVIEDLPTY